MIIHHYIHEFGACNARNIGLKEVKSNWLFFADDDISIKSDFIEKGLSELKLLKSNVGVFKVIEKRGIDTVYFVKESCKDDSTIPDSNTSPSSD